MNLKSRLLTPSVICVALIFITGFTSVFAGPWLEVRDQENQLLINKKTVGLYTYEIRSFRFLMHGENSKNSSDYQVSLHVKQKTELPDFAFGFQDQHEIVSSGDTLTLRDTLYIHPKQAGKDTIQIWGSVRFGLKPTDGLTAGGFMLIVDVQDGPFPLPVIYPEPEFTQGLSNIVHWQPARSAYDQEAYFFNTRSPEVFHRAVTGLFKMSASNPRLTPFENLRSNETYGYFIKCTQVQYNGKERYFFTDFTYSTQDNEPPETVDDLQAIQRSVNRIELSWHSVEDAISGISKYYIYRVLTNGPPVLLDSLQAVPNGPDVLTWDDTQFPRSTFYYIIRAADQVGNEGIGIPSNVFQLGNQEQPVVQDPQAVEIQNPDSSVKYITTRFDTLFFTLDGREDSIRFQAVRDSIDFFRNKPELPFRYFDSGWLRPNELPQDPNVPNRVYWIVDYSQNKSVYDQFLNGHTYYKRCVSDYGVARDTTLLGNVTIDLFAPDDISNLNLQILIEDYLVANPTMGYTDWRIDLDWKRARDFVSGLQTYHVYRQIEGADPSFVQMVPDSQFIRTTFSDTVSLTGSLITNPIIRYRIGSMDSLGHQRTWQASAWEVAGRALGAPVPVFNHITGPDAILLDTDTLFSRTEQVQLKLTNFDMTDVQHFVVAIDDQEMVHQPAADNILTIQLPFQELSRIMVRAVYYGGRSSIWSQPKFVIQSLQLPPHNLQVRNDSLNWEGDIYLAWERPTLDVDYYEIWRYTGTDSMLVKTLASRSDSLFWTDDYRLNELNGQEEIPLTTYQTYGYKVRKISIFGESGPMTPMRSAHCNRPPRLIKHTTPKISEGKYVFTVYWTRPEPNLVQDGFHTRVRVYEDSLDHLVEDVVITDSDTIFTYRAARADHNYIFRIQEQPHQQGLLNSGWSRPYTVSSLMKLEPFTVLPQPRGDIYVDWNAPDMIQSLKIDSFIVFRDSTRWSFPASVTSLMDDASLLLHNTTYTYQIFALDSLDQVVATNVKTAVSDTGAVYIPDILSFPMRYFNSDSVLVSWVWRDIQGNPVNDTRGAVSYVLQTSVSKDFPDDPVQTVTSGPHDLLVIENQRMIAVPLLGSQDNEILYFRIGCNDAWQHPRPFLWSTNFYPHRPLIYDPIPPNVPQDVLFASQEAYYHGPDSVILTLQWSGANVEFFPDTSQQYRNPLLRNVHQYDLYIGPAAASGHARKVQANGGIQSYTAADTITNLPSTWQIVVTDSALNQTQTEWFGVPYYFASPQSPTPNNHRRCTIVPLTDDTIYTEYAVEMALLPSHFQYGYEVHTGEDMNSFLCQSGWMTAPSFVCTSGWGRVDVDTTWFRVKARRSVQGQIWESGWSEPVSYTGQDDGQFEENQKTAGQTPAEFAVLPNYPNPFNPSTHIQYALPEACQVSVIIYNIHGKQVRTLVQKTQESGYYTVEWLGRNNQGQQVASGIYLVQISGLTEQKQTFHSQIKMMLVK